MRRALRSKDARWVVGLTALALAARLAFVLAAGRTVTYDPSGNVFAFNDTFFYAWTGAAIERGDGFSFLGHTTAHWPPGYSAFLAGVFHVFGATTKTAIVANAVVGALTVPLVYLIARRTFEQKTAIAAAAALALFPGQILIADVALSETLYAFELVAFVALTIFLRRSRKALIVLGIAAGLAALTRGEGLLFPLIVLAFGWAAGHRTQAAKHAAITAAVMLLVVAPWTIRNASVAHGFVPVASNASFTLWSGHNDDADGGPVYQSPAELARLSRMSEAAAAAEQRHDAVDWAIHHPGRELVLIPLKLKSLASGDSLLIDTWIDAAGQHPLGHDAKAVATRVSDVASYGLIAAVLLTVALAGRALWRIPAMRAVLALLAVAVPLYGFVYYGNVRYRVPLEPLMLITAAAGLAAYRGRGRRAASG